MDGKFDGLTVDEEITVFFHLEDRWEGYDVVWQKWHLDGIDAESLIFLSDDVKDVSDTELEDKLRRSALFKSDFGVTIDRKDLYTYLNFNFEAPD
jgi:hypothetical protein